MKLELSQHTAVFWSWLWPCVSFKKWTNWAQNGEHIFLHGHRGYSEFINCCELCLNQSSPTIPECSLPKIMLKCNIWMDEMVRIGILYITKNVNYVSPDLFSHKLIFYCLGTILSCQGCAHSGGRPCASQGQLWYFLFSLLWQGTPLSTPPSLYLYDGNNSVPVSMPFAVFS